MAISTNEQTEAREAKNLSQSYTPRKVADLTLKLKSHSRAHALNNILRHHIGF